VGTTQSYFVRVIDAYAQAAQDTTQVQVVDTTPPVVACNVPATIANPPKGQSFQASAQDICDPNVDPVLSNYSCFKINGAGKVIDTTHACNVTLAGDTITIQHGTGIGTFIQWTATGTDHSGNHASVTCQTQITQ